MCARARTTRITVRMRESAASAAVRKCVLEHPAQSRETLPRHCLSSLGNSSLDRTGPNAPALRDADEAEAARSIRNVVCMHMGHLPRMGEAEHSITLRLGLQVQRHQRAQELPRENRAAGPFPHPHRDCARPPHICTGTGRTRATSVDTAKAERRRRRQPRSISGGGRHGELHSGG